MRKMNKKISYNILTFLAVCLILIIGTEITLRFVLPEPLPKDNQTMHIVLNSSERGWGLLPYDEGVYAGAPYRINSLGFRDYEYDIHKPKNTFRVAIVGDSIAFGKGVTLEETFAKKLEQMLNSECQSIEVLNFGVSGYTTVQQYHTIRERVFDFSPDMIFVLYFLNDPDPFTAELYPQEEASVFSRLKSWWYDHSYLYKVAARGTYSYQLKRMNNTLDSYYEGLYDKTKGKWKTVSDTFYLMKNISKNKQVPIIIFVQPELYQLRDYPFINLHEQVLEEGRTVGLETYDLYPFFKGMDEKRLQVSTFEDRHPNGKGHSIIANGILSYVGNMFAKCEEK